MDAVRQAADLNGGQRVDLGARSGPWTWTQRSRPPPTS